MAKIAEQAETVIEPAQVLDQVLASKHFTKAPLLSALLSYTCRRAFEEGAVRISEREIGVDVFHRETDYDPREDNIVRNYVRQLRKRLDEYYAAEGLHDSIRITFPKGGGYLPAFTPRANALAYVEDHLEAEILPIEAEQDSTAAPVLPEPQEEPTSSNAGFIQQALSISCLILIVIVFVLLFLVLNPSWKKNRASRKNMHPLWSRLFEPNVPTTWVSLDSGLVLMSIAVRQEVSLDEYIKRDFSRQTRGLSPKEASEALTFAYRRYTDFVEVEMVHRFDTEKVIDRNDFLVKFARDVRVNDLRLGNVILHGAPFANPWVEMYEPEMNFVGRLDFEHQGTSSENRGFHFENKHPKPNEPSSYFIHWNDPQRPLLGSVAFLPGFDGKGVALIVQGSSLAASEAVQDYLLNDDAFLPFLKSILKPDGTLPFFEVVLESHEIDGTPGSCKILASHVY